MKENSADNNYELEIIEIEGEVEISREGDYLVIESVIKK